MSGVFGVVRKFFRPKGLIGYDLQGNKYFEIPNPAGGRMKRFVQYKKNRDLAEYSRSELKPPVQWRAWLSHTRVEPPTLEELEFDHSRQQDLQPKIAAIEAREREERIRQGYLLPDGTVPGASQAQIAGPSTPSERAARLKGVADGIGHSRSGSTPSRNPQEQPQPQIRRQEEPRTIQHPNSLNSENVRSNSYPVPTPRKPPNTVAQPSQTVDPAQHSSAEDLRRLAMEDTKRRIAESKEQPQPQPEKKDRGVEGVGLGTAGKGLQPRRRRG
ncbi:uncharacterized protein I303_106257 [Kwoniella dejecticola CBS 10117]|uniref:NADH dehydrogenase [ubiquinone] 1 alpha subcomplex subunit n=1 Tax=Kwoniella dejecticola CBS 10117 TaxID=1296121 RepID=A0A1A6A1Q3_9TREE|nr:uncharacterized protein I303_06276 [Kwoniella dejecticola CBS 10117]OBR83989.1 hypothetical protein I303_06276 [Kwoniella dejecticola CBS 10117]